MNKTIKKIVSSFAHQLGYEVISCKGNMLLPHHLVNLFRLLDINCVLDVGAHDGTYGKMLRVYGYIGDIISFEPLKKSYELLEQNSHHDPGWKAYNFALGNSDSTMTRHITTSRDFSSFLEPNEYAAAQFPGEASVAQTEDVLMKRLDSVIKDVLDGVSSPRLFLKMDTQGYDLEVLAGASACVDNFLGLQSELSLVPIYNGMPDFIEALEQYKRRGFELTGLFPVTPDEKNLRVIEFDCTMIRTT